MNNQNIQIGIDLGTTNSEIAINNNGQIEVIKNLSGDEYTPSVFGIDKANNKLVGKRAYEKLFMDSDSNFIAEVKRLMGTSETIKFERWSEDFSPEQISAEILLSLKEDVSRKYSNINTKTAVITIPAFFSTLQAEATKRAGKLAGFDYVGLLQEPIAAAVSYGFMSTESENWLVYDLGGGTFDVALISSREGTLTVLGHNGDNFLGGKDFDWLIVEKLIIPNLMSKFNLHDFHKGNPKYKGCFSKLKYVAETAKKELSQLENTMMEIDGIGDDENGKEIFQTIELKRSGFESLIKPTVDKTIELAKQTLKEAGINQNSISKIILVGGSTQTPLIKSTLKKEFNVTVDSSVDPLTVVARGACIYATSMPIPAEMIIKKKPKTNNARSIKIFHESLTSETEETITGIVEGIDNTMSDYFIQIQGDSGFFRGTKVKLKNSKFVAVVTLEEHKSNLYWIYLFDSTGNSIPINQDSFTITHGLTVTGAPIPHSVGLAVAKKDFKGDYTLTEVFEPYFEKNSVLPLKLTKQYRTTKKLKKGDNENVLPIKVYEGESEIPDRNTLICELCISGTQLPFDLPASTDVDITIDINESREVNISAYIPMVDYSMNARATVHDEKIDVSEMEKDLNTQIERLQTLENNCPADEREKIQESISSISGSIRNANADEDDKRKARSRLKDLKTRLDKMEKESAFDKLVSDFRENIDGVESLIEELGLEENNDRNHSRLMKLKSEGEMAISTQDKYLLPRVTEQVHDLGAQVYFSHPAAWVHQLEKLKEQRHRFISQQDADYYFNKAERAIGNSDIDELKRCVRNLVSLLPPDEQNEIRSTISGITH